MLGTQALHSVLTAQQHCPADVQLTATVTLSVRAIIDDENRRILTVRLGRLDRRCRSHDRFLVRDSLSRHSGADNQLNMTDSATPPSSGRLEQVHEWHQFIGANEFCIRICRNDNPDNWKRCSELGALSAADTGHDRIGRGLVYSVKDSWR